MKKITLENGNIVEFNEDKQNSLGKGSSAFVFKGFLQENSNKIEVAVKSFFHQPNGIDIFIEKEMENLDLFS